MPSNNIFNILDSLDVNDNEHALSSPEEELESLMEEPESLEEQSELLEAETVSSENETRPCEETQASEDDVQDYKENTHYVENNTLHPEDEPQSAEEDLYDQIIHASFDLAALEATRPGPVFTRALLREIVFNVSKLTAEYSKPASEQTLQSLEHTGDDGKKVVVWKPLPNADSVWAQYMTRVELSPDFARQFGDKWHRHIDLRSLNPHNNLMAPYHLFPYTRPVSAPMDPTLLKRLLHTQKLWLKSESCRQISTIIHEALRHLTSPITQIVGIGLGYISPAPAWYAGSALQHITAIHLSHLITRYNTTHFPFAPAVRIILSDPSYTTADIALLSHLAPTIPIHMNWSDPEVLLAINRQTLLLSAYLVWKAPLMQILADLFSRPSEKWIRSGYFLRINCMRRRGTRRRAGIVCGIAARRMWRGGWRRGM